MKLAIITDSSAVIPQHIIDYDNLFCLDVPVTIGTQTYTDSQITMSEFYKKMATSESLPKTSQPSIAEFDLLLSDLKSKNYTHVLGLFLSSGISSFWGNIQFLIQEHDDMTIAIPDTRITSAPLGYMVETAIACYEKGDSFEDTLCKINKQIEGTSAFIVVDDLNHLVKGGRLSNTSALIGNLLSIKPILYFNNGVIDIYEKVRTEKKAIKRLIDTLLDLTKEGSYQVYIIHSNALDKAETIYENLVSDNFHQDLTIVSFGSVIATHLGEGAIAFSVTPKIE